MEKNQHNSSSDNKSQQSGHQFTESQPGQQLPANANTNADPAGASIKEEQHSASSFPQQEGETLGTP